MARKKKKNEEELEITLDDDENTKSSKDDSNEKLQQAATSITKGVEENLTEEEKAAIEKGKNKSSDKKIETVEEFGNYDLSEDEQKEASSLTADLSSFIKSKVGDSLGQSTGVIDTLPTGIDLLDAVLGGGFGLGTMSVIAGNPGTFKSSLVGQVIGNSQKKFKGKMLSTYLDSESAMTKERLYQLGAKNPAITPYNDVTVESVFKTIEALCAFKAMKEILEYPGIVAWDSVANTTTDLEKADTETSINSVIGLRARILSVVLPRYVSKLKEHNMSMIAVNQLRDNIQMGPYNAAPDLRWMGDKTMPGGNALKFNAFHILLLKIRGDLKSDRWGFSGVRLDAKCIKNKLFTPNIPISLIVDFNTGISNFWTNYNFMKENKIIDGTAWQKFVSQPDIKWQATKGCKKKYDEDPEFRKLFDKTAKESIDKLIVEEYKAVEVPDDL